MRNGNDKVQADECPRCGGNKCVVGEIDCCGSEYPFSYKFYPLHFPKGLLELRVPEAKIKDASLFQACPSCGHIWGEIETREFQFMLDNHGWDGGPQVKPEAGKPLFQYFLALVILSLLVVIVFFNYNT